MNLNTINLMSSGTLNPSIPYRCRRKDVHLCFIMSPGKIIFAVLEL